MPRYVRLGEIPRKRHTQFRKNDGTLYAEQLFGTRGFSGPSSTLYHHTAPTTVADITTVETPQPLLLPELPLRHHHLRTAGVEPYGDAVSGRIPLMVNADVSIGLCVPAEPMDGYYKNADGDDLLFVHQGTVRLESMFGALDCAAGDYIVVPRGVIYRLEYSPGVARLLVIESATAIESPRRYRNEYGQLLENSPYCERDVRVPNELTTHTEQGDCAVRIKARGSITRYTYPYHPLDVVGWDGFVYPWAFNILDFEPITGSIHMPPPTHQTFEARNFVVCSFVPRMLDYHPNAVPIPYNHSNLESDEMLYYVNSKFGSRKGIEEGSITLHPSGIPHGPQPGAVEASLGAKRTEELAVMVDTFRPLRLTNSTAALEDESYPWSWLPEGKRPNG